MFICCGIETSFDDTCIALLNKNKVLSNIVINYNFQIYKGIVPNIIYLFHIKYIFKIFRISLVNININNIDLISITYGPGLLKSLFIGIILAKFLSLILKIPIYKVNHLHAHILTFFVKGSNIIKNKLIFPFIILLISGGHTLLLIMYDFLKLKILGKTLDNSLGEIYDKIGNLLNFKYPGGYLIDKFSIKGKNIMNIFIPKVKKLNFSFSGIFTKFKNFILNKKYLIKDICITFQKIIFKILLNKVFKALKINNIKNFGIVGGVSNNKYFIQQFKIYSKIYNWNFFYLSKFIKDNAVMIANIGYIKYKKNLNFDLIYIIKPNPKLFINNKVL
ncbi:MAG: tRNA (adenosine(37)-N6)-threonylcarbamoyltransferase complex transferase subunit TsaD [Candidatus Shikimatogenerans sp. AspAUS03]|uniref:N(6)-L-threonylcarbamoyladenine synthase n=1 Tax=Candidatus Shikimatogenerans sp. AspAUS03 TaxID=3158563 RepID=A0AAU7QSU5_9FLAO